MTEGNYIVANMQELIAATRLAYTTINGTLHYKRLMRRQNQPDKLSLTRHGIINPHQTHTSSNQSVLQHSLNGNANNHTILLPNGAKWN